ncbi:MAG: hypothetical protein AB7O59_02345 [Pirellulales bacterium]
MALVLEILLGVAILAAFGVAYMSARAWPIYQVVLVVFLFLTTVAFLYLSARTLATHNSWRNLYNNNAKELARLESDTKLLQEGGPPNDQGVADPKGLRQLRQDLQKLAVDRGGVLWDVTLDEVKDNVAQLTLKSAGHGLTPETVVFVFGATPMAEGGKYLGEFKVAAVGEDATKVQITPNLPLTESQAQRFAAYKGPLTMYTRMPIDDRQLFASLDDATRKGLLPAASLAEFAKTDRTLRDYEQVFREHYVQTSLIKDTINRLTSDIARTVAATDEAQKEAGYRQAEKENLTADLQLFQRERQAIADYQATLAATYQQVLGTLKTTFAANRDMAAALTQQQLQAADAINRRAGDAASPGPQPY